MEPGHVRPKVDLANGQDLSGRGRHTVRKDKYEPKGRGRELLGVPLGERRGRMGWSVENRLERHSKATSWKIFSVGLGPTDCP